jgi:hypothetical protein
MKRLGFLPYLGISFLPYCRRVQVYLLKGETCGRTTFTFCQLDYSLSPPKTLLNSHFLGHTRLLSMGVSDYPYLRSYVSYSRLDYSLGTTINYFDST